MINGVPSSKTFIELYCLREQTITPHRAGRVLEQHGPLVKLELYCRQCGAKVMHETDELPVGYRIYRVRVTGEDNPSLPVEFRPQPLPYIEEEMEIAATSAQHAHELAEYAQLSRFKGHLVKWYVDGLLHLDERF